MKFIVGLGNPGKQYEGTFHNAGFRVVDEVIRLLKEHERCHSIGKKKHALYVGEEFWYMLPHGGRERIFLQKPETYMNDSGKAVHEILRNHRDSCNPSEDLLVVHDDGDILLGRVRVDRAKRAAGHRGVASITSAVGTTDFIRFRVGIRREGDARRTEAFVLQKPRKEDRQLFEDAIRETARGIICVLEEGVPKAQMYMHTKK